jgi:tetratricopeptide (TPR) repeat protein
MKVALLVCALAGTAAAGPDTKDTIKRLDALEKAAQDSQDPAAYTALGLAYLDVYNANMDAPDAAEILYNAGVSLERGGGVSGAIQAYTLIERYQPQSKIAVRALARLARLYADVAMYDRAAEKLEQYATKYTAEKDAMDAISDAAYFRKGLGDRDKAIADTQFFIKTFGAKHPNQAADAMWSLSSLYEGDDEIKHLREYLASYGSKGGTDRVVMAHAKLGQMLWQKSCPIRAFDGLCVRSDENAKKTCGKGTSHTLVPTKRNEATMKEALAELAAAKKEFENQRSDDPVSRYWYAQAKVIEADVELESFLALELPKNLDFDPANKKTRLSSVKRFDEWLHTKTKTGENANNKYMAVLAIKDAASSITAAERTALLSQGFANALVTGEIPKNARAPAVVDAYCDAMNTVAEPVAERSVAGFGVCLAKSTELSWFDESSRVCERELARLEPDEFPLANELHARADGVAPVVVPEPPPKGLPER